MAAEVVDIAGRCPDRRRDILDRVPPPNAVRSLKQTAAIANISVATLKRLIRDGFGPRVTQISERRKGITDSDRITWLEACAK